MVKLRARGMLWQFGSLAPHKSISEDASLLRNNACRAFGLSMNYKVLDLENDGAIKSFQIWMILKSWALATLSNISALSVGVVGILVNSTVNEVLDCAKHCWSPGLAQIRPGSKSANGDGANCHTMCKATKHAKEFQVFLEALECHLAQA